MEWPDLEDDCFWQSEDSFWQSVVDTVTEGLVAVDAKGVVRHVNRFAVQIFQLEPEKAEGLHFSKLFCPSLPLEKCWVNLALQAETRIRDHQFAMERSNGSHESLIANLTPMMRGRTLFGALISLKSCENPQLISTDAQRTILASMAEGLFTVDSEWRITSFNRAARQMTGWTESEVLGKQCKSIFGGLQCARACPLALTLEQGKAVFDHPTEYVDKAGRRMPASVNTAILYDPSGDAVGGVVSMRATCGRVASDAAVPGNDFHGIVGKSSCMLELFELIGEVADSNATILILGESGTGKELVANAIQQLSPRKEKPFVRVNCAAFPDTLIESELFGHVKGAFTDAHADRVGRFQLADEGTIFLDEIGDLSPPAQLRLLRVLEEGEFQRLGSSDTVRTDVRMIAATNRDLWNMVQGGQFRDDLYYRLNVIPIMLPPLRQRREDLPCLVEHFMQKYRCLTTREIQGMSSHAYDLLMAHDYPGNVRELENIIEHAFARTRGPLITENKLPVYLCADNGESSFGGYSNMHTPSDDGPDILRVLMKHHWNRERAAKELRISRTTLWRRMRDLDLLERDSVSG